MTRLLMVSLDRYLGSDSGYYPSLGIFDYQSREDDPGLYGLRLHLCLGVPLSGTTVI